MARGKKLLLSLSVFAIMLRKRLPDGSIGKGEGRGYYVSIGEHKSQWTSMTCRVPQGSILALLLFSLYMLPLSQIMRNNQIAYHSYADDTQIYLASSPNDYSPIDSLCQCIDEINSWMCQNFLLNKKKTVFSQGEYIPWL